MTDRELAYAAYLLAGIPYVEWGDHFLCDQSRHLSTRPSEKLSDDARATYRAILASYGAR